MFENQFDPDRVRETVHLLEQISDDALALQFRSLVENNGIWQVPDQIEDRQQVLYEVQLLGIDAMASHPSELAINWMRAARNVLKAEQAAA